MKVRDVYVGLTVDGLTVVGKIFRRKSPGAKKARAWVLVRCACGTEYDTLVQNLRGRCSACSSRLVSETRQAANIPAAGEVFGRWTVLVPMMKERIRGGYAVLCRCECSTERVVALTSLRRGTSRSCGCLQREAAAVVARTTRTTHGSTGTRLFRIWSAMKSRTTNPAQPSYQYYGARGIRVCESWLSDFAAFQRWALASGYSDELTIDRVDPEGNYEPANCRWLTRAENTNRARRPGEAAAAWEARQRRAS